MIEDEQELGGVFEKLMIKAGLAVDWAKSWEDAERFLVPTATYAVVFTDNDFPGGNGMKSAKAAKSLWGDIPVFLVSGRAGQVEDEFLEAGGTRVFHKTEFREALKIAIDYINEPTETEA